MPAAYSEPGSTSGYPAPQLVRLSLAKAANAAAKAAGGSLGTATATNPLDVSPDATATVVVTIGVANVPAGAKVIMYASMEIDVKPPEGGGAANTATFETRFASGGPETVVDSFQEDLVLGPSLTTLHNIITMVSETDPLAAGSYTFDVAVSSSIAFADNVPAGKGRLTVQVVGS